MKIKLKVLGSGSSGNCYILENENEALIIEAGLPFMEVKKALNFNVMKIVGMISSHEHGDHYKYFEQYKMQESIRLALVQEFPNMMPIK